MPSHPIRLLVLAGSLAWSVCADWVPAGPYGGEAEIVRSVPRQPGTVIAATRNGLLYKSVNAGASWNHVYFPAQLSGILHALEVDGRDPDVWYAGFEAENAPASGLYKTRDGGKTWTRPAELSGKAVWSIAVWRSRPDVVAAGTSQGVFLSRDAGGSWAAISPADSPDLRPVVSLAFHPANPDIIYAGTTHLPWRTHDGGAHWESIHSGMLDDSDVFSIAVSDQTPATVYASACSGVYRSADGGNSWTRLPTPPGAFRAYLVALDPRRPGVVFAATSAGMLRSSNGGTAWARVTQHAIKSISFDPSDVDTIYFASVTGGLQLSRDGGNTLRQANAGFSNRNFSAFAGSGGVLYASTVYEPGSGGIFRTGDLGLTWRRMPGPGTNENVLRLAAAPDNPDLLYAAGYRSLHSSRDGGRSWASRALPRDSGNITALLPLPRAAMLLATATDLFRLNSGSWLPVDLPGGRRGIDSLQSSGGPVAAALTGAVAFRTEDGGASWTACGQPAAGAAWYGLAFDSAGGTALGATSVGLFRSTDRCASWQPVRDGLEPGTVSAAVFHPKNAVEALAVQYGRVFRSNDGGRSWRPLGRNDSKGAYPSVLLVLPAAPQRLFALFPRRGVLSISIDPTELNSTGGD